MMGGQKGRRRAFSPGERGERLLGTRNVVMMMDKNPGQIAQMLRKWMADKGLMK